MSVFAFRNVLCLGLPLVDATTVMKVSGERCGQQAAVAVAAACSLAGL